ncbi:deaminase [Nocardioides gansuensis]|uniref:Deaminase n=1 Tax=Nocardioides gansuensis TaxID=2138300 RepID=A0A2T8FCQ5_9ACTN|nr:dihydrofolate reductase family protein [Nocardioides gansuensis]PVG83486.1 deaminase [Nocardioides gansuensis]
MTDVTPRRERRVAAEVTVSMDGYSGTGPEDDMSWAMAHIASEESELHYEGIWRGVSTALLGRTNWEGFSAVWPTITSHPDSSARTRELGEWLATVEKVVFSTTLEPGELDHPEWTNARASRDVVGEVTSLKARAGRDIMVLNSASIIQTLLRANLIDDLYLTVLPATLGGGTRVLPEGFASTWRLASVATFPASGAVALRYQRP